MTRVTRACAEGCQINLFGTLFGSIVALCEHHRLCLAYFAASLMARRSSWPSNSRASLKTHRVLRWLVARSASGMPKRICGLSKPANFSGGSPIPLQKLFWVTPVKPVDEAFKRFVDIEPVGCFQPGFPRVQLPDLPGSAELCRNKSVHRPATLPRRRPRPTLHFTRFWSRWWDRLPVRPGNCGCAITELRTLSFTDSTKRVRCKWPSMNRITARS